MLARVVQTPAVFIGACLAVLIASGPAMGFGGNNGTVCPTNVGPDVIVGDMQSVTSFSADGTYDAFSFGTTSCNVGNANLQWQAFSSNRHPAIAQALYRYKTIDGAKRFEMIGQSWLKHGFLALTENICGCGCNGNGGSVLGVGCSDPYTAGRNASQSGLGPKWQVDASSGYYPTGGPANPAWSGSTMRRLRVKLTDLEPSNASVRHFGETQYVTQDDAAYGNKNNNASYRECYLSGGAADYSITVNPAAPTQRAKPAILAWKALDPTVTITNVTTPETINNSAGPYPPGPCCSSALVIVAAKATDLGGGIWHYEFAVQNVNSHRSIASFSVPLAGAVNITNVGFHDVDYHSGDGEGSVTRDGTDWAVTQTSTEIKWETVPFATNPNSNALRWGTTYNFRFDANTPPTTGDLTLGTYRVVGTVTATSVVPTPVEPPACPGDISGDGVVGLNDLLMIINTWGPCGTPCPTDITGDGQVGLNDLLVVINAWGDCPSGFAGGSGSTGALSDTDEIGTTK